MSDLLTSLPPIPEIARAFREGRYTAEALVSRQLTAIREHNPHFNAFVHIAEDHALREARDADTAFAEGRDLGPLQGIAIGVKDLIDVAGQPSELGARRALGQIATADATVVHRLRKAGAIIIGKLATYEYATVGPSFDTPFAPARNPWNLAHITGGSSSGSASAISAGMVRAALGTDTGGSIRSPASYCGIVGLKPGKDRVSNTGVFPLSVTLDHIGPMAATVEEAAMLMDAIAEPGDMPSAISGLGRSIAHLVIGYARNFFARDPELDPAVLRALDDTASLLSMLGARIEEIDLPPNSHLEIAGAAILHAEAYALHREGLCRNPSGYGKRTFANLAAGAGLRDCDITHARRVGQHLTALIDETVFGRCAAFITPTTLSPAPPVDAFREDRSIWTPMRTLAFNLTGHPALSVPCGFADGLPIGLQIVGPRNSEAVICQIGAAFEGASDVTSLRACHSVRMPDHIAD